MHNHIAFLDEWGNNGLDFTKRQVSTHFIIAALTLPKDKLPEAEEKIEAVRKRFFQNGPIKSSKVGDDAKRRKLILAALLDSPFQIFALVVDKRQLTGEGLRYKGSFYKFLHGLADRELYKTFPNLELIADTHGSETFMDGFIRYVQDQHIPNLFNQSSFGFVNDKGSVLVQAADFVAGTLARCYDETVISDQRQGFIELLRPKLLALKYWPDVFAPSLVKTSLNQEQYHPVLADLGVNLAQEFVHRKLTSRSHQEIDQLTCLTYLLFHFRHIDPTRYISSRELIKHVEDRRGVAISLHYFQTRVIAPLRDAGVLIASSSKGYKLPASERDLFDFVNHSNTIIQPLLSRINKCRDQIRLATDGAIDILERSEYDSLRRMID
ncbi:hypothetical protein GCM10028807_09480 [Spirosoma daeguense]